jgi:Rps23 Pro-64 3,4-dihydroxylase Tpa1-like proline 4-hydroxylase
MAEPQTPVLILDEFLVAQEWRALLEFTIDHFSQFAPTHVIGEGGDDLLDYKTRRSRVLFNVEWIEPLFINRLAHFMPHILFRLGHPWFPVSHVEVQLTATNNDEYFRMHTDNDANEVWSRAITFVYFFHREPRGFTGGELRIYDTFRNNGSASTNGPYRTVYPLQNQMVLFTSGTLHEILPVGCPSGDFLDSRFTINGWLHR